MEKYNIANRRILRGKLKASKVLVIELDSDIITISEVKKEAMILYGKINFIPIIH